MKTYPAPLIDISTHIAGNRLDLLLNDNDSIVANAKIDTEWHGCKSSHFPRTSNIKHRYGNFKAKKREIYNFKHANWDLINKELLQVNREQLLSQQNKVKASWNISLNQVSLL